MEVRALSCAFLLPSRTALGTSLIRTSRCTRPDSLHQNILIGFLLAAAALVGLNGSAAAQERNSDRLNSAASSTESASDRESDRLRVVTFNINWGNVDVSQVMRLIRQANADLVFLQETTTPVERLMRRRLRDEYSEIHFIGGKGKFGAERFGLLSRFPVLQVRHHPPTDGFFGTMTAETRVAGRRVQLINVHLSPFFVRRGAGLSEVLRSLSAVESAHAAEAQGIVELLADDAPIIVAGDFNSISTFSAPRQMSEAGLTDCFAAVRENPDQTPTWHWPIGRRRIQLRIDYIFCSRHFRTVAATVTEHNASDHFVLQSDLVLSASPSADTSR